MSIMYSYGCSSVKFFCAGNFSRNRISSSNARHIKSMTIRMNAISSCGQISPWSGSSMTSLRRHPHIRPHGLFVLPHSEERLEITNLRRVRSFAGSDGALEVVQ